MKRLQQSSNRLAAWSDSVENTTASTTAKRKAAKIMKRSTSLEARRNKELEQKSSLLKNLETTEELKIAPLVHHKQELVCFSNTVPVYDKRPISAPLSFVIRQGERIALDGKNGSGKSSLLKLLCGEQMESCGSMTISSGLSISYVPQDTTHLTGLLSEFAEKNYLLSNTDRTIDSGIFANHDFCGT